MGCYNMINLWSIVLTIFSTYRSIMYIHMYIHIHTYVHLYLYESLPAAMAFETEISIYTKRVCSRKSPYNNFACAPTRQVSKPCVFVPKYHSCTWSERFIYTYWIWKNGKFPIPTSNTPRFAQVGTHCHFSPWWIYQVLVWTWYIPKWRNGNVFSQLKSPKQTFLTWYVLCQQAALQPLQAWCVTKRQSKSKPWATNSQYIGPKGISSVFQI